MVVSVSINLKFPLLYWNGLLQLTSVNCDFCMLYIVFFWDRIFLTALYELVWKIQCSPDWPWTQGNPPASQMLGLRMWTNAHMWEVSVDSKLLSCWIISPGTWERFFFRPYLAHALRSRLLSKPRNQMHLLYVQGKVRDRKLLLSREPTKRMPFIFWTGLDLKDMCPVDFIGL